MTTSHIQQVVVVIEGILENIFSFSVSDVDVGEEFSIQIVLEGEIEGRNATYLVRGAPVLTETDAGQLHLRAVGGGGHRVGQVLHSPHVDLVTHHKDAK